MADTLPNIDIPVNMWVNLYTLSGVSVGTRLVVMNVGVSDIYLAVTELEPPADYDNYDVLRRDGPELTNNKGDSGVWVFCPSDSGKINISIESDNGFNPVPPGNSQTLTNTDGKTIPSSAIQFMDNIAMVDHFGQLITGEMVSRISVNFSYRRLDEQFDVMPPVTAGAGVVTAVGGYAEALSIGAGDIAQLSSRNSMRYSNGRGFYGSFTASFTGIGIGKAGLHDDLDGFYISADTTGPAPVYKFGYLNGGVENGEVDIDIEGLDMTKLNIFFILGGFLGVANPTLFVRMDTWRPIAVILTEGRLTEPHVGIPAFPLRIDARDGMTIRSGSWHAGTIGEAERVQDRGFSLPNVPFSDGAGGNPISSPLGVVSIPANSVATLIVIHAKVLYNGLPNKIAADIINYDFAIVPPSNSDGVAQFQLVGNPTIVGSTYDDVGPSSVLEFDSNDPGQNGGATGQFDLATSGGTVIGLPANIPYSSAAGNKATPPTLSGIQIDQFSLDGLADETLALLCRNVGSSAIDVYWTLTWIERQI